MTPRTTNTSPTNTVRAEHQEANVTTPNAANTLAKANTANGEHAATPNTPPRHRVAVRRTPNTHRPHPAANTANANASRTHGERLRLIPPFAALGTSFVLQVTVVTDTLGRSLANSQPKVFGGHWIWYAFAALLGIAVASCAEGGAAYLMDLYDKHLLARDSTWVLKAGMVLYVAGSAAVIHWWTQQRGLPSVLTWLLAGMSASALFLWSRGARWKNREAMRAAGQLDTALPRLPMSAKLLHPIRWAITLWLISWEPAATTTDARARYEQWRSQPRWWTRTNSGGSNVDANKMPPIKAEVVQPEANTNAPNADSRAVEANVRPALPAPRTPNTERVSVEPNGDTNTAPNTNSGPVYTVEANTTSDEPAPNTPASNVRPISTARTPKVDPALIKRIEREHPEWLTNPPSVRTLAAFAGASSPSTGQKILGALREHAKSAPVAVTA